MLLDSRAAGYSGGQNMVVLIIRFAVAIGMGNTEGLVLSVFGLSLRNNLPPSTMHTTQTQGRHDIRGGVLAFEMYMRRVL